MLVILISHNDYPNKSKKILPLKINNKIKILNCIMVMYYENQINYIQLEEELYLLLIVTYFYIF